MLPTGVRLDVPEASKLRAGQPFGQLQFDDAFTGLVSDHDLISASIHDQASGCTVTQQFDTKFHECVVYTPPHREAICIEPLTCVPNCFELARLGIESGLKIVPPGGSFSTGVNIFVS
jgi:aldose 1-epimerase